MCLGIPGRVVRIDPNDLGILHGQVSFGGVTKDVCFACVPDVRIGEYVVVHVGFAISRIDEQEAKDVFRLLEEMAEIAELEIPQPGRPGVRPGGAS